MCLTSFTLARLDPRAARPSRPLRTCSELTTHSEWVSHHHRDTYATIIGLPSLLSYAAMADGEAPQRVKFEYCEVRSELWRRPSASLALCERRCGLAEWIPR